MKTCRIVRAATPFQGKQGLDYFSGISAETAGSEAICMHMLVMPPGATAKPHYHERHETAIYMLEGVTNSATGPTSSTASESSRGTMCTSRRRSAHALQPTEGRAVAIIARTDPNEQESVVLVDKPS